MIRQNMHLAFASLRAAKVRSFLTMIAVIIGVSSFVVVTATVDGLRNETVAQINSLGGNLVSVVPGDLRVTDAEGNESISFGASAFGGQSTLSKKDVADIKTVDGVIAAAPLGSINGSVSRGENEIEAAFIIATTEDYPAAFSHNVAEGEFLKSGTSNSRFVVIGSGVVDTLFAGEATLGSRIDIKSESFTVVGIMEEQDSGLGELFGVDQNDAVYISTESGERLTGRVADIVEIDLQLDESRDPNEAIPVINELLLENHNGEQDFTVLSQDDFLSLIDSLLGVIKLAGQFLSYIMLFVASVVILLIMLITVRERTREIGIRKSIGATNRNILVQFLTEAVVLSWVGSFIGLVIGYVMGLLLVRYADITPAYSLNTILVLLIISTCVGVIAGVAPAWMAARKDPVESLRHE